MRRIVTVLLLVGVIAGVAAPKLAPLIERQLSSGAGAHSARAGGESPLRVDGVVVSPSPLSETVSTTGTLLADEQVDLQAEVSGRIVAINFAEGGRVAKGDLLVKLNDADLRAALAATAREHELARSRERRAAELLEQSFVRQEDYDAALSALQVLEARMALTEAQIARTEIRAPFDGVAGLRYASEGAVVGPQTRISTLQNTDSLKIEFTLAEMYADRIGRNDTVEFSVTGSERAHFARVYARDARIDTVTRTLTIRAVCENRDGLLLPGAFANVRVTVGHSDAALLIPAAALILDVESTYVFVHRNGIVERRTVVVGVRTDTQVHIVSGLQPGDVVITSGLLQIRPGMAVTVSTPGAYIDTSSHELTLRGS